MQIATPGAASLFSKYRLLIEVAAVVIVVLAVMTLAKNSETPLVETTVNPTPPPPPPMTEFMAQILAKSQGFQHLVSYTDSGFEPPVLNVKKGDIVRFSNSSSRDLWVASIVGDAGRLYPAGARESCGQSTFDSCVSMKPLEFWEFTFDVVGEWSYRNNAHTESLGVVRVQ